MTTAKDLRVAPISSRDANALFTEHSVEAKRKFAPFGYVYLLRWPGEVVKIGSTKDPYSRLRRHANEHPDEVWLLGPLLKFATPELALAVEKHLQLELEGRAITEEIFAWPELARGDLAARREFGCLAGRLFREKLCLRSCVPKEGWWELSPEACGDYFCHAAESPAYWEDPIPVQAARKVRIPDLTAKRSAALKVARANPKVKADAAAKMAARWADPEFKSRVSAAIREASSRPETKANLSASAKANWADPVYRAKMSAALKAATGRPEVRAKRSAQMVERWADPARRAKQIEGLKAVAATPAYKEKKSKESRARWQSQEYRTKQAAGFRNGTRARSRRSNDPSQESLF